MNTMATRPLATRNNQSSNKIVQKAVRNKLSYRWWFRMRCAAIGIGTTAHRCSSATPPDMRVRIRRFERLRLVGNARYSQLVEVVGGEAEMDEHGCVVPPAPRIGGRLSSRTLRHAEFSQLGIDPRATFPLL